MPVQEITIWNPHRALAALLSMLGEWAIRNPERT
jgi:hypothetical protein